MPKPKSDTALTKRAPLPSFAAQPLPLPLPAAEDAPKAEPVVPVMQPELVTAEQALEQAVEYVVVPAGPAPGTAQPTAEQTAGSEHGQKTVLFTEDDPVVLKVFGKRLNDEGFVVKSAEDGLVGLDILPQLRPDLVVLDLMLPKLHGLEVLKFMRADVNLKGTPVIVLSNAYMEGLAAKAIEAGANKGLLKTAWPKGMGERAGEHGARRLTALGIARDDEVERGKLSLINFEFYGAPCVVHIFIDGSLGEWSIFDMGLFTQNLILAAHSLRVERCLQASVTNYAPEIKNFLGIGEGKKLVICISLGYPDEKAKLNAYRSLKQKPDEFTRWYE